MKYKAGDKVRVIKNLEPYRLYGGIHFFENMEYFKEKILTIKTIHSDYYYTVEENAFKWSDEMLEDVQETVDDLKQKDEEIERLKLELKNKDCRISYLEGQIYVYEKNNKIINGTYQVDSGAKTLLFIAIDNVRRIIRRYNTQKNKESSNNLTVGR